MISFSLMMVETWNIYPFFALHCICIFKKPCEEWFVCNYIEIVFPITLFPRNKTLFDTVLIYAFFLPRILSYRKPLNMDVDIIGPSPSKNMRINHSSKFNGIWFASLTFIETLFLYINDTKKIVFACNQRFVTFLNQSIILWTVLFNNSHLSMPKVTLNILYFSIWYIYIYKGHTNLWI